MYTELYKKMTEASIFKSPDADDPRVADKYGKKIKARKRAAAEAMNSIGATLEFWEQVREKLVDASLGIYGAYNNSEDDPEYTDFNGDLWPTGHEAKKEFVRGMVETDDWFTWNESTDLDAFTLHVPGENTDRNEEGPWTGEGEPGDIKIDMSKIVPGDVTATFKNLLAELRDWIIGP